jgi:hypothetical protein
MKNLGKFFLMMSLVSVLSIPAFADGGEHGSRSPKSAKTGTGASGNLACGAGATNMKKELHEKGTGESSSPKSTSGKAE